MKIFYSVSRSSRNEFPDPDLQSPPKTIVWKVLGSGGGTSAVSMFRINPNIDGK